MREFQSTRHNLSTGFANAWPIPLAVNAVGLAASTRYPTATVAVVWISVFFAVELISTAWYLRCRVVTTRDLIRIRNALRDYEVPVEDVVGLAPFKIHMAKDGVELILANGSSVRAYALDYNRRHEFAKAAGLDVGRY